MNVNPYVFYDGDCAEAFTFYSQCLGLPVEAMMRYGDTPGGSPVEASWDDKIMHACINIGESMLMASDAPPGNYHPPQGISVALQVDSVAEAESAYTKLSAGGEIHMPLEKTFWAERFGLFTDKFGIKWMVNCDPLDQGASS
ncbi:VOC family protein [Gilvimarinus algae]|uniref:VOC family protein n=1 Tax=Gilvimarinus algae TaxID=3058037 RepID=A0ABT8THP6_9GAMM|nr:VOC family protein [Gilvimarinus sp. SDUM040014]MDO3383627.1 VOC family protein [Gilvimarinus sp. SDUM040014]